METENQDKIECTYEEWAVIEKVLGKIPDFIKDGKCLGREVIRRRNNRGQSFTSWLV